MKRFLKKAMAAVLAVVMLISMSSLGFTSFAVDQSEQASSSSLSSITAATTLNSDGSITLSGTANLWGWINKIVVFKGNQMSNPTAAYLAGGYIKSDSPSGVMDYNYSFTLTGSDVTTEGYTVIVATSSADAWAAAYVASPSGAVEGEGGSEEPGEESDGTSFGPGNITGTCTITSAGKVKVKLNIDMPSYIKQVRWVKGNHVEDAQSIASTGTLIAEYYNPNAPVSIPDYVNSYSFSTLLSGDNISQEGYTFAVIDAYGNNVTAKYIPTREFSVNPADYPDLDHASDVWLPEVKLVLIANGSYIAATVAPLIDGKTSGGFEPPFIQDAPIHYLDTDSSYVVIFHTNFLWITSSPAACILDVDPHGCVTVKGATFSAGTVTETTNKCTLAPTTGGIAVGYTGTSQPERTVFAYEIPDAPVDGGVYGAGVDDATLDSWATLKVNNPLTAQGGERQAFSVNYIKDLIAGLGVPARSKGINGLREEMIAYYSTEKPLWNDYMYRDTYTYSDLYLHDVYCQGVWDSMPAAYGWMQDQYTEPGKYIKQQYSLSGNSYGLAGGGQNPWVLCDYLERNAGVAGTAGEGWQYGYDEVAQCPYLFNAEQGVFLSYENRRSLQARCDYILQNDLGGVIIWEISGDNSASYPLTSIIYNNLRKGKSTNEQKRIIAYFVNWAVYNPYHQYQSPDDLPWDKLTHVNYSFFDVADDFTIYTMDGWADTDVGGKEMFAEAQAMKEQYPDTKLIVSVGGWTRGNNFGTMVSSAANRATFVNSVVRFLNTYPYFDGIDLDWEYPGCPRQPDFDDPNDRGCTTSADDATNYSLLCEELRAALDSNFGAQGRNILSACVPASPTNIQYADQNGNLVVKQDIVRVANACTYINLMTYDYHGAFDPVIGYNAPLYTPQGYSVEEDGTRAWSTEYTVDFFVDTMGIDPQKISIGTPYYSRGWAGVKTDSDGVPMGLQDPTAFDATAPTTVTLSLDKYFVELNEGETETVTATVDPAGTAVVWNSADETVATVDGGIITAVSEGTTTVTATAGNVTRSVSVTVNKVEAPAAINAYVFEIGNTNGYWNLYDYTFAMDVPCQFIETVTYVPFRIIAQAAGASDVSFNSATGSVRVTNNAGMTFDLTMNSTECTYTYGGTTYSSSLNAAPAFINGSCCLPIRDVSNITFANVKYVEFDGIGYVVVSLEALTDKQIEQCIGTAKTKI